MSTNQPTLAPAHDLQGDGWPNMGVVSGPQDSEPANSARSRPGVEHDPTVTNQQGPGTGSPLAGSHNGHTHASWVGGQPDAGPGTGLPEKPRLAGNREIC